REVAPGGHIEEALGLTTNSEGWTSPIRPSSRAGLRRVVGLWSDRPVQDPARRGVSLVSRPRLDAGSLELVGGVPGPGGGGRRRRARVARDRIGVGPPPTDRKVAALARLWCGILDVRQARGKQWSTAMGAVDEGRTGLLLALPHQVSALLVA